MEPPRLSEILRGLEGKWVALRGSEVVAAANTSDALFKQLRSRRIRARAPSGCLPRPGVARQIGVTPDRDDATPLKIGGETRLLHPADVTLRLAPEPGLPGWEWRAEVGFFSEWTSAPWQVLLGQIGFFDQFTVTFSRSALQLAMEPAETFDGRYGADY